MEGPLAVEEPMEVGNDDTDYNDASEEGGTARTVANSDRVNIDNASSNSKIDAINDNREDASSVLVSDFGIVR